MKKFKFKFPPLVWVLLMTILIVCAVGLALNIYNLTQYLGYKFFKILPFVIYTIITGFLIFVVLSVMLFSNYTLKKGYLYVSFGIFVSKTKIDEIVSITHFKKSDKLVVYFKHQAFSVIVIAREKYDDFVLSLRKLNSAILFSKQFDGEDIAE
jgi:hypothetical protein